MQRKQVQYKHFTDINRLGQEMESRYHSHLPEPVRVFDRRNGPDRVLITNTDNQAPKMSSLMSPESWEMMKCMVG